MAGFRLLVSRSTHDEQCHVELVRLFSADLVLAMIFPLESWSLHIAFGSIHRPQTEWDNGRFPLNLRPPVCVFFCTTECHAGFYFYFGVAIRSL
jgi:hypothetical protein